MLPLDMIHLCETSPVTIDRYGRSCEAGRGWDQDGRADAGGRASGGALQSGVGVHYHGLPSLAPATESHCMCTLRRLCAHTGCVVCA